MRGLGQGAIPLLANCCCTCLYWHEIRRAQAPSAILYLRSILRTNLKTLSLHALINASETIEGA